MISTIIKTDGTRMNVEPKNGTDFQLDELQEIVGGYIEIVHLSNGQIMVVNEEGLIYDLPYNAEASSEAMDIIVGDVLVCDSDKVR